MGLPLLDKLYGAPELLSPNTKPITNFIVDKEHPIARHMLALVFFNEYGEAVYNAVTGEYFDEGTNNIDGTGFTRSQGSEGNSITGASDHTSILELHKDLIPDDYDHFTFLHKVKYKSNTVDHGFVMTGTSVAPGTTFLWADTLSNELRPGAYSGVPDYGTANSLPVDDWVTWGANYVRSGGTVTAEFYIEGEYDSITGDLGNNNEATAKQFSYLNRFAADRPAYAEISWIAVWAVPNISGDAAAALTRTQHKAFYADPEQVLILKEDATFIPEVAAAGAYTLTAEGGSYAVVGTAASLEYGRKLGAGAGAYVESGQAASLEYGKKVGAQSGTYSVVGQAASLTYTPSGVTYTLTAEGGTYTEAGQAVGFKYDRKLVSVTDSYAVAGQVIGLAYGRALAMGGGAYAVAGQDATLTYTPTAVDYTLVAAAGAYVVSGSLASLVWSGAAAGAGPAITMPLIISNGAEAALPISIAVSSGGGVSGLAVTMAIRDGSTLNSYLDFNDLTFKTSGWVSQTDALVDQSGGYYADTLNVGGVTNLPDTNLIIEFAISGSLNAIAMGSVISAKSSILGANNALTLGKFLALKDA